MEQNNKLEGWTHIGKVGAYYNDGKQGAGVFDIYFKEIGGKNFLKAVNSSGEEYALVRSDYKNYTHRIATGKDWPGYYYFSLGDLFD